MKRFNQILLFSVLALLLTVSGIMAQPSLCTVTGTLYNSTGAVCSNCKLTLSKARQGSTPLSSPPQEVRADSNGAVSFTAVQGSFVTFTGTFSIGRYNFSAGLEMYIPLQSSATLTNLQTAEDALNALIGTTVYAPADAGFITKTASTSLSNEFALGSLATGILKNTTTTGVPSIATASDLPLISTLTADASPDSAADYVMTYDASAGAHKKVLLSNLPGGGGGGAVSSVFGRTGAVVAVQDDYTFAQIDKTTSSLADLTTRSASDLSSGTLPDARFPATLPAISGVNLTALNASNLASGTVALARLSGITTTELSATAGITNGQLAGSIANAKLANSAITIAGSATSLGGAITASTILDSIGSTRGSVLYRGASGWAILTPGVSGQFLKTLGAGADPAWADGGSGITVGTTTVASGTSGRLPYNNAGVYGEISTLTSDGTIVTFSPTVTTGTGATAGVVGTANSLTTGNGFDFSSSSVASGNVVSIAATGTAAGSNTKTALKVATSGANGTSSQSTFAGVFSNTSTGTSSTNYAIRATATGGTTNIPVAVVGALNNNSPFVGVGSTLANAANAGLGVGSNNNLTLWYNGLHRATIGSSFFALHVGLAFESAYGAGVDWQLNRVAAGSARYGAAAAASPVAQTLSVQDASGTNIAGATWTHQASLGTSQGAPGRHSFTAGGVIAASGTTAQTAVSRLELGATKVLTNNSATTIVNVTNASNTSTGGVLDYCVEVTDGTDTQYECGMATYGISNKAGAFSGNTVTKFGNHQNATAGTLTVTIAISGANPGLLSVNANSSLTPSTGYPRITYSIRNLGQQAIAVQ